MRPLHLVCSSAAGPPRRWIGQVRPCRRIPARRAHGAGGAEQRQRLRAPTGDGAIWETGPSNARPDPAAGTGRACFRRSVAIPHGFVSSTPLARAKSWSASRRMGLGPGRGRLPRHATQLGGPLPRADAGDAKVLADLVRTDRHNHRPVAGDSDEAAEVRILARAHQQWPERGAGRRQRSSAFSRPTCASPRRRRFATSTRAVVGQTARSTTGSRNSKPNWPHFEQHPDAGIYRSLPGGPWRPGARRVRGRPRRYESRSPGDSLASPLTVASAASTP